MAAPPSCGPIVYLGPSLPRAVAEELLTEAEIRQPIRRGDLYRDRLKHGSVFVILDGIFFQEQAIPPREILDVLEDGALIVGASSMGALRAAECWPAGMRGIGSIYRLFRAGCLHSDDEVAVTFNPDDGYRPLSVSLISMRYALKQAIRRGRLDRTTGDRIAQAAQETFYPDRTWAPVLARAGVQDDDGHLASFLTEYDLKKEDARRALRAVSRWLAADPDLLRRPRRSPVPFRPSDELRERHEDPLAGRDPEKVCLQLGRWQLLSGRYTRHLPALLAAHPEYGLVDRLQGKARSASLLVDWILGSQRLPSPYSASGPHLKDVLLRPAALRLVYFDIWKELMTDEARFAKALWGELSLSEELNAEIFRWRAVREAVGEAHRRYLKAESLDRYLAETEIADAHGFPSWSELGRAVARTSHPWSRFVEVRDDLATAKCLRRHCFNMAIAPRYPLW